MADLVLKNPSGQDTIYPGVKKILIRDSNGNTVEFGAGVDTSTDTVNPNSLLEGFTAHDANGDLIEGACTFNADTTDDTVTAAAVLSGYTAHNSVGGKITGGCTYNSDTSADTVEAAKLLKGITAHKADGAKITGTCTYNADTSTDTVTAAKLLTGITAHNSSGSLVTGTCAYNADTSSDTVTAENLLVGIIAHDATGALITGTMEQSASTTLAFDHSGDYAINVYHRPFGGTTYENTTVGHGDSTSLTLSDGWFIVIIANDALYMCAQTEKGKDSNITYSSSTFTGTNCTVTHVYNVG